MPNSPAFDLVLSGKAAAFLVSLSRTKQRKVVALLERLVEYPTQLGDYATHDENGREVQHLVVGDWHFSFWPDHGARELRITDIDEL